MRSATPHKHALAGLLFPILIFSALTSHYSTPRYQRTSEETKPDIAHLAARLESSDEEERREAVMKLWSIEGKQAQSLLEGALADRSAGVRVAAVNGLARRHGSVASLLAARLRGDKDQSVRKSAAHALATFHDAERTAALIAALHDKDVEVRGAAAVALGDHPDPDAIPALISALSDNSAFVRAHASRALGVNGRASAQAVPTLIRLLTSDQDSEVKRQAAAALGGIGDPAALPALEKARLDKDPYLSRIAAESVKRIANK
jgi:HEAT repeat protein